MSADLTANDDEPSAARISPQQRRRSVQRKWRYTGIIVLLAIALLMIGIFAVTNYMHRQALVPVIVKPDPVEPSGLMETIRNAVSRTNSTADETASDADLAKIELELHRAAFEIEFAQAMQAVRHLESAKADWEQLLESTQHDNIGRRIGGSEPFLLQLSVLRSMPPPIAPENIARGAVAHLNSIQQEATSADDADSVSRLITKAVETRQHVFTAFAFHQARTDQLHAMREAAASLPESDLELHAAVSMRATALANTMSSAAEAAARELEASLKEELAQSKQQREDSAALVAQLKSQLARVEKGEALQTEPSLQGVQTLASREDYKQELDKIRTDLIAFTTPGYVQPESADKLVYRKSKHPFSYSALERIGALEDSDKGRSILLRVGGSKSATQQNDRPLGSFPRMNSILELQKPDVAARVREAQRLIREYGPFMVEDGHLSP